VNWITSISYLHRPGLSAHPALSTVARGYRHIRTSWGYRHIQACTSSSPGNIEHPAPSTGNIEHPAPSTAARGYRLIRTSPGAIGTSRLVQAIGTAPHHPLTTSLPSQLSAHLAPSTAAREHRTSRTSRNIEHPSEASIVPTPIVVVVFTIVGSAPPLTIQQRGIAGSCRRWS